MKFGTWMSILWFGTWLVRGAEPEPPRRFYAHEAVLDRHGVIAPWYRGQNGPCDFRVRIAAETLKRYPWAQRGEAVTAAPHYVFNGSWQIAPDGTISIPPLSDWANGDLGQRAAYVLSGLVDYYRYSGDPAAIAHLALTAEVLLHYAQTGPDHPWPNFLISVPVKGKPYGRADPHGFIQLDIVAEVGLGLVRAYELTGEKRWLEAAQHWADLLAEKRNRAPGAPPWGRYANPEDVPWEDLQTGGVAFLLAFFDELLRLGYTGKGQAIVEARDAGRAYLRDVLLPRWTVDETWGRNYWDWPDPVQAENVTEFVVRYLMENPDYFPHWRDDCRNVLSLFLNRTGVSPASNGDVYAGAWAYPESSGCCGRSLWYGPMELATVYAQYGVLADSEWAREMARRQILLATYDVHETGVVEDNIDGGQIVAGGWFKIAHPMALKHVLGVMAWLPEALGPNRENHILRSASVVQNVRYGKGQVEYVTFAAAAPCVDVLRLAFAPDAVMVNGQAAPRRTDLAANGYTLQPLPGGDCLVTIRHDGSRHVCVRGEDPQQVADDDELNYSGAWSVSPGQGNFGGGVHGSSAPGATMTHSFTGNQVRVIGRVGRQGGQADVYLDGEKQLVGIDCWCPLARSQQVLYYKNGLSPGEHQLKIVVKGAGNPWAEGRTVYVDAVQWSAATGDSGFGEGGGPTGVQRIIFGYTGRTGYVDSEQRHWRPATEWIVRSGPLTDVVATSWWTERRRFSITHTPDPELYRYGVHAPDFTVHFTVGPGTYYARLKFAETRVLEPSRRAMTLRINGQEVVTGLDLQATAGGYQRAVDLVFNGLQPVHGVISIRFTATYGGEAMVQAIEVGPGPGGRGATPVCWTPAGSTPGNLLVNPGFETGLPGALGRLGETAGGGGWQYLFASPSQSYIWPESAYAIHPDWGLPEIRTGQDALRTHTDGQGHTMIYQEVPVVPGMTYRASVFVRAVDLRGKGFGTQPGDSAGLVLQELGPGGEVLVDHGKVAVTEAGDYRELTKTFTASEKTARVRFILDTVIGGSYDQGHVTYDDCSLVGPGTSIR